MLHTSSIPSPEDFFLRAAPYQEFELNSENFRGVLRIQCFQGTLDTYCIWCSRESVFRSAASRFNPTGLPMPIDQTIDVALAQNQHVGMPGGPLVPATEIENWVRTERLLEVTFNCSRDPAHTMAFFMRTTPTALFKVGQSPSLADLQTHRIKRYRNILDEKWIELSKAIGLKAHGVGIGAFVYLRRVFEFVVERAHGAAKSSPGWNEQEFLTARMDAKIKLLKDRLPDFLVRNARIYPILGKGIHELEDDECLSMFDPIEVGIELILDEEIERSKRAAKIKEAQAALDALNPTE